MTIDVIICTYNRPDHVCELVDQLFICKKGFNNLIVVDSSDKQNAKLKNDDSIRYIRSDRKSQPYQRYLGAKNSDADILVYFDDDVLILKNNLFEVIHNGFNNTEVVGVSLGIHYENGVPIKNSNQIVINIENRTGKISWLGRATGLPNKDMFVEYFPGPIMAFRKSIVFDLFDEYLFLIFEEKSAMGEDKAISLRASKFGKLLYFGADNYLYHPPIPSTYYLDDVSFIAKTTFSRLWLSKVYAEVRGKNRILPYLYFIAYFTKQIMTALGNLNKFKGNLIGLKLILKY